ncbi:MAG: hypothetical protein ABF289_17980 [Clostridiales bacterium]
MNNKSDKYKELVDSCKLEIEDIQKNINKISNIRLIVFILGFVSTVLVFGINILFSILSLILFGSFFVYLIIIHQKKIDRLNYAKAYLSVNKKSSERINNKWHKFDDIGEEYAFVDHSFSGDLDVFGKFSLFQWVNTTFTIKGRKIFSEILLNPLKNQSEIKIRQNSIDELANDFEWRQAFNVEGILNKNKFKDPKDLLNWLNEPIEFINSKFKVIFSRLMPAITLSLIVLTFIFDLLPNFISIFFILFQGIFAFTTSLKFSKKFRNLNNYKDDIFIYTKLLNHIEKKNFSSTFIKKLKENLENKNEKSAHQQMKSLEKVVNMIDVRYNMFYFVINILLLWDLQCVISYENWKTESDKKIEKWLEVIGWFEALSSLSIVKYDNKDWIYPEIIENNIYIEGEEVGHPLLDDKRVCNDVKLTKETNVSLITGSNMSGKSTYLRTIGLNLLMSYYGLPVCAKSFKCSILRVYTCMRISDNLEKNISSFYAELLRIKQIIKALDEGEPIFFLLDEIFKGTNSIDRHIGAKELIMKLSKNTTLGIVSTHDLELSVLEEMGNGKIRNLHFSEFYENKKIKFNYKMHKGVSKTRNAVYLMEMIGLKVSNKV